MKKITKILSSTLALTLVLASAAPALVPSALEAKADITEAEKFVAGVGFVPEIEQRPGPIIDPDYTYVEDEDGKIIDLDDLIGSGTTVDLEDHSDDQINEPTELTGDLDIIDGKKGDPVVGIDDDITDLANLGDAEVIGYDLVRVIKDGDITIKLNENTKEVVFEGEGAMPDGVYNYFLSTKLYVEAIDALFARHYEGRNIVLEYNEAITDFIALDRDIHAFDADTREELVFTPEMRAEINPADFAKFSPSRVVIGEGITTVSDYAFTLCGDLEEVLLPSTLKEIGYFAFAYCTSLERIVVPETIQNVKKAAFLYTDVSQVIVADAAFYHNLGLVSAADADGEFEGELLESNAYELDAETIDYYLNY